MMDAFLFYFVALTLTTFLCAGLFFAFDHEILRGHFAKKVRKYFGVEE